MSVLPKLASQVCYRGLTSAAGGDLSGLRGKCRSKCSSGSQVTRRPTGPLASSCVFGVPNEVPSLPPHGSCRVQVEVGIIMPIDEPAPMRNSGTRDATYLLLSKLAVLNECWVRLEGGRENTPRRINIVDKLLDIVERKNTRYDIQLMNLSNITAENVTRSFREIGIREDLFLLDATEAADAFHVLRFSLEFHRPQIIVVKFDGSFGPDADCVSPYLLKHTPKSALV